MQDYMFTTNDTQIKENNIIRILTNYIDRAYFLCLKILSMHVRDLQI